MTAPVYLDYNATTPIDPAVVEAMLPWLREGFGNPSSDHPYGRAARGALGEARAQVATLIGAPVETILFTGSATEANNLALLGSARAQRPMPAMRVDFPFFRATSRYPVRKRRSPEDVLFHPNRLHTTSCCHGSSVNT